jgi:PBP1b-binding outer membrane lipoprotein LpoB
MKRISHVFLTLLCCAIVFAGCIGAESAWRTANTNSVQAAAEEWNVELKFSDVFDQTNTAAAYLSRQY